MAGFDMKEALKIASRSYAETIYGFDLEK